jgi:Xaa-Pro aminopeptidase
LLKTSLASRMGRTKRKQPENNANVGSKRHDAEKKGSNNDPVVITGSGSTSQDAAEVPFDAQCPCCFRPGKAFSFSDCKVPTDAAEKLAGLRALMSIYRIDAYLVASEDAHSSEYVSEADERRAFISGFTGSAGTVVITATQALLWTDARYFLQAEAQLGINASDSKSEWTLMKMYQPGTPDLDSWVANHLAGKKVGIDAALLPADRVEGWLSKKWAAKSISVECLPGNLIDCLWVDRPIDPANEITTHPMHLAGESVDAKLSRVRQALTKASTGAIVLNALDQIAWLYNLRGSDIECNPVFFAYSVVTVGVGGQGGGAGGTAYLYLRLLDEVQDGAGADVTAARHGVGDTGRSADVTEGTADRATLTAARAANIAAISAHLSGTGVELRPYSSFTEQLPGLLLQAAKEAGGEAGGGAAPTSFAVMAERGTCTLAIAAAITEAQHSAVDRCSARVARVNVDTSPVESLKACKNETEREGIRLASLRDSEAICRYFAWLERKLQQGGAREAGGAGGAGGAASENAGGAGSGSTGSGSTGSVVSEVDGAEQMTTFRKQQTGCVGDSFPTISAAGGNGSIIHYHAERATAAPIVAGEVYLCGE